MRPTTHPPIAGWLLAMILLTLGGAAGCTSHRVHVDPVEVRPIHMTVDINIKIDRELDQFFEFEDDIPVEAQRPDDSPHISTPPAGGSS